MAFPQSPLPIKAEFLISGAWTNVTSRVRLEDMITIRKGFQSEQGNSATPDTVDFTLNNRDGLFSNRNPNSIYYGLLPKNTQCRFSVTGTAVAANFPPAASPALAGNIVTADKAVLDTTDLEVRVDVEPNSWTPGTYLILAGKWEQTANQRSWIFFIAPNGELFLEWSTDGTAAGIITARAGSAVPSSASRLSLKCTLDVNNGAAGKTAEFSSATSINGTYTVISTVITAGTTTIFAGTGPLYAGNGGSLTGTNVYAFIGKFYAMQLRASIGGAIVANMDATVQTSGATSWSDGLGTPNTWTVTAPTGVTADDRRFWGEVSEFPQRWDTSGKDVWVPIQASSILRRLTAGHSPVVSPIYRYFNSLTPVMYYPLESGASTAVTGTQGALLNDISFSTDSDFLGSAGFATLNSTASTMSGIAKPSADASYACFVMYFRYPTLPTLETTLFTLRGTGTVPTWKFTVTNANFTIYALDKAGNTINSFGTTFGTNVTPTKWIAIRVQIHASGGFILPDVNWYQIGDTVSWGFGPAAFVAGSSVGRFTNWATSAPTSDNVGVMLAHAFIGQFNFNITTADFFSSASGYLGETAVARFLRLTVAAGISAVALGDPTKSVTMDRQPVGSLVDLLQECCDADAGFLLSAHTFLGLIFRTRRSLYNQTPGAVLNYHAQHLSGTLEPTDDDRITRNDVTITRPRGGFGRSVVTTGPNNTSSPTVDPQGVGLYDTSYQLNLDGDSEAVRSAEFATFLGTWPDLRYPVVSIQLQRSVFVASASLTASVVALEVGDPFSITNLPAWLPPDSVELMVRGQVEVLENRGWTMTYSTIPYGPYRNANNLTSSTTTSKFRAGASNTTVQAGFTTSATTFTVQTPVGSKWGTLAAKPQNFPMDVMIAGERITVGAIAAAVGANQVFSSCTRSINGIVKAHLAGEPVQIFDAFYAGF